MRKQVLHLLSKTDDLTLKCILCAPPTHSPKEQGKLIKYWKTKKTERRGSSSKSVWEMSKAGKIKNKDLEFFYNRFYNKNKSFSD